MSSQYCYVSLSMGSEGGGGVVEIISDNFPFYFQTIKTWYYEM